MTYNVKCKCGRSLRASEELLGKRVKCPGCQTTLQLKLRKPIDRPENDISDLLDEVEATQSRQREVARDATNAEKSQNSLSSGVNRRSSIQVIRLIRLGVKFVYLGLILTVLSWITAFGLAFIGKPILGLTFFLCLSFTSIAFSLTGKSMCLLGSLISPKLNQGIALIAVLAEAISIALIFAPLTSPPTGDPLTDTVYRLILSLLPHALSLCSLLALLTFMDSCVTSKESQGLQTAIAETYRRSTTLYLGMPLLMIGAWAIAAFLPFTGWIVALFTFVIFLIVLVRWTIGYLETLSYFSLNFR